jgi:putative glutamine transport system permease protein
VGVLGVGIYHGAYISEVIRAGILAVPAGQKDAAFSQGFTYWGQMRYIVLPQAKLVVLPPFTNQMVFLIKNTSVMAMVAGGDLMYCADSWSSSNLFYGPAFIITGALYFILCFPLTQLARKLEKRAEAHK